MDKDEIVLDHVYQFIDLLLDYRRDQLLEVIHTHEGAGFIKADAAGEIIDTVLNVMVPESMRETIQGRVNANLLRQVKASYFQRKESINGGRD